MTRYHFHMQGHAGQAERVAMRLDDPDEARAHAVVALGDLLHSAGAEFWDRPDWQLSITDETGRTIGTLTIQGQLAELDRRAVAGRLQPVMAVVA